MKNKKIKLLNILIIFAFIMMIFVPMVNASDFNPDAYAPGDLTSEDTDSAINKVAPIFNAIRIIGLVISISMIRMPHLLYWQMVRIFFTWTAILYSQMITDS